MVLEQWSQFNGQGIQRRHEHTNQSHLDQSGRITRSIPGKVSLPWTHQGKSQTKEGTET